VPCTEQRDYLNGVDTDALVAAVVLMVPSSVHVGSFRGHRHLRVVVLANLQTLKIRSEARTKSDYHWAAEWP
jgi:hypothetical protein